MKALLLAAGEGTRLRPWTLDRPKAMVPVAGTPMIGYALAWLRDNGVREVAINLHYRPEPLVAYVGDGERFGVRVTYSSEPELLGSAGAIAPIRDCFAGSPEFIVLYGDVLTDLSLDSLLARHRERSADLTIALTVVDDPTRAGIVELGEDDRVVRFVEKPRADGVFSRWGNAGVYVCGPRVLDFIGGVRHQDFGHDVIPAMVAAGARVQGFRTSARVVDIGSPERLREADRLASAGSFVAPPEPARC